MSKAMTIKEIVREYLEAHEYDGLAGDECGCGGDDLYACGTPDMAYCEAAYRNVCADCAALDDKSDVFCVCIDGPTGYDQCYSPERVPRVEGAGL